MMASETRAAKPIAHVDLSGSPEERGLQHGAALIDLIPAIVHHHRPAAGMTPELDAAVRGIEAALTTSCPDVLAELKGIADGARVPYEDILWLNAGYEAQGDALPHARYCTALGLPNTPEGPLVAKTDDVALEERGYEVLFRVRPAGGHALLCYAFGGTVWNQGGMNARGLALAMTGLPPAGWRNRDGIPGLLLLRQVLHLCATVEDALAYVTAHPLRGYGCTLTLADATGGDVFVAEVCGAGVRSVRHSSAHGTMAVRRATREATVRTNHPLCAETVALKPDSEWAARYAVPGLQINSEARLENARRLVRETPWTVEGLKGLLGDHTVPGAICQHGQAGLHTSIAMIMVPWQRVMIVSEDYGCGTYSEYAI
ncbi:MAG: C45 family peptidase [Anaerolineae bacterium]